jgi:beta-glucosidase-like glycosyl hydrolase/CubicO group peptidase (beta-lactamase class C family)
MKLRRIIPFFLGLQMFMAPVNPGFYSDDEGIAAAVNAPAFLSANHSWVDSVMGQMTLEEKIAQLLMVQAYSNRDPAHLDELMELVEKHKVGGIIFFQGGPVRQAHMTNVLQRHADIPLLIAMDAEWGLGMRLDSVISYPRQMELGALRDNRLIFRFGQELAQQLKDLGVHMNFAPVADINNNPGNPVINTRSFGESPGQVAARVNAAFLGMQTGGILVTAKHFPGHGDTHTDSHYDLPVLNFSRERLDSVELYPFRHAIKSGLTGIMVAHLQVNALDDRVHRPASLSDTIVTHLLQETLGFRGLVVTDAMNMKGVSDHYQPGDAETEALKAGNDIILMPSDVSKTIHHIRRAVQRGEIPESQVDRSCRKILLAKKWLGLDTLRTVETEGLYERLNDRRYLPLREQLAAEALTLVKNDHALVPFTGLETMSLATINIGAGGPTTFTRYLDNYKTGHHYYYDSPSAFPADSILENELNEYNTLIISSYYTRSYGNNYDIPAGVKEFVNRLNFEGDMVFCHFGYPYALGVLGDLNNADAILVANTNQELNQQFAAQALFGGTAISGRLPVSVGKRYPAGTGHVTNGGIRLSYGSPEGVDMDYDSLRAIEEIIYRALALKATPGCQVLVARKGRVVWHESYGHHTYQRKRPVRNEDLYDLASITKIASTIPSLMRLQDQGRFSADSMLGSYFPELDTSQLALLQIRDILTHQAGLKAWIPFYMETIEPLDTAQRLISTQFNYTYPYKLGPAAYANRNIVFRDSVYEREYSPDYPLQVADHLYLRRNYRDTIYRRIQESPLGEPTYLYSDLGYYYLFRAVENITDTLFYPYNWFSFYGPLGAETLGFLPLNRFSRDRIVPTENDLIFRRQLVHGHVHDPGAAMLGGVCGHAGLFSNANDLAKLMQMYLNYGTYGGERFIDSVTIAAYTRCQFCENENRRALGFDRPVTDKDDEGPACNSASEVSFGHSGFTGTITWVDPKYDLLYIFLSNRIHPDQFNIQLITENVRTDIQEQIYRSLKE